MTEQTPNRAPLIIFIVAVIAIVLFLLGLFVLPHAVAVKYDRASVGAASSTEALPLFAPEPVKPQLDKEDYDRRMTLMANYASSTPTTTARIWPVDGPYPKAGAILPFNRIIAYYGNFYSTKMGVLGEYEESVMLDMLRAEQKTWEAADPTTPTIPAINYIAITAQELPGKENLYMLRMPDSQIDKALEVAKKLDNGIVILDIQIGFSTFARELDLLKEYLAKPNVHLGVDPEFRMIGKESPGHVIGSVDAADINFVIDYLAELVREHDLPPKVLVIHRFTQRMVTNYQNIKRVPEVQVVMDMDGWGPPAKKINTYKSFIYPEPVQFTGFKIFYKNDLKPPSERLLTPQDLLNLTPRPLFIQYQ